MLGKTQIPPFLEEKGEAPKKTVECTVNMGLDAYIPEKYISGSMQRIDAYRKISLINSQDDLYDVADEFIDRYGDMPKVTDNLLRISLLRALGRAGKCTKDRQALPAYR